MLVAFLALTAPWPSPAQQTGGPATDVYVNVTGGGAKKLNIAVPEFTVVAGTDTAGNAKLLASVTGSDLTFSGLFSVVAGTGAIPANNPAMLEQSWRELLRAQGKICDCVRLLHRQHRLVTAVSTCCFIEV